MNESTPASSLPLSDQLSSYPHPYFWASISDAALFDRAMEEADRWHLENNAGYHKLWGKAATRPLIPVNLFKEVGLGTPVEGDGLWLTSSGTSGTGATKVFFDQSSLSRIERAMFAMFMANGIPTQQPSHFLLLSPDPRLGTHPGYATTFLKLTAAAPIKELVFAVDQQGRFDAELALTTLKRWAAEAATTYILGLTVFFEQLALTLKTQEALQLKGEVRGITGGGWKGLTKTMERGEIMQTLAKQLVAPKIDIRDIYGMTEHPIQYLSCPHGHFHQPVYSRILIMGADGKVLEAGQKGLIRLQSPFYASLPAHDILTQDSGELMQGCPCGNPTPYLIYHGRISSMEGICAAEAAQR